MKTYVDIRVRVPIEMHERMERQAKAEYSNISEVTRRLWVGHLEKNEQEKPR
jgi:Arc/MetJ-type ribon-helix-helix transcriptional regulator